MMVDQIEQRKLKQTHEINGKNIGKSGCYAFTLSFGQAVQNFHSI
jgi:hypothetical protein